MSSILWNLVVIVRRLHVLAQHENDGRGGLAGVWNLQLRDHLAVSVVQNRLHRFTPHRWKYSATAAALRTQPQLPSVLTPSGCLDISSPVGAIARQTGIRRALNPGNSSLQFR